MSFFNFFKNSEDKDESGDEEKEGGDIDEDYEIGKTIAEEVIPYSLEYYLGINPEGEDYEDLDDDEDDDDEDDEDGDDDDDDKKKKSNRKKSGDSKKSDKDKKGKTEKPECK